MAESITIPGFEEPWFPVPEGAVIPAHTPLLTTVYPPEGKPRYAYWPEGLPGERVEDRTRARDYTLAPLNPQRALPTEAGAMIAARMTRGGMALVLQFQPDDSEHGGWWVTGAGEMFRPLQFTEWHPIAGDWFDVGAGR